MNQVAHDILAAGLPPLVGGNVMWMAGRLTVVIYFKTHKTKNCASHQGARIEIWKKSKYAATALAPPTHTLEPRATGWWHLSKQVDFEKSAAH